jgi:hypothetical protein
MAELYPPPDSAYSIAGLGQVYGQFYDGGPRGYRDDPWQRHNIVGGGRQSWLSADIAASLQSYSRQLTTQGVAAPAPMNFDFTLTLPELPPLPDLVLPPAQTQPIYTNIPNVQVAPAANIGGARPPFQRPPAGRAQIPGVGGRGGGGGGGGGGVGPHSMINTVGAPKSHYDAVFDTAAANDVMVHNGVGWAPLAGVASSTRHTIRTDADDNQPDIVWMGASTTLSYMYFSCARATIISGVITAEDNSLRELDIATDAWINQEVTAAVPGVSAGVLALSHSIAQAPVLSFSVAIGCLTLTVDTDAKGHVTGITYA